MICWHCQKTLDFKIGFRSFCPHCDRDLHVCANCRFYYSGKPNDCSIPGTEFVRDRQTANFCEDFQTKLSSTSPSQENAKKSFNDLFKEEMS